jgi:hypothetical protein
MANSRKCEEGSDNIYFTFPFAGTIEKIVRAHAHTHKEEEEEREK